MTWLSKSVRGNFLAISSVFVAALFCLAGYTWYLVKSAARESEQVLKGYYTAEHNTLVELTGSLLALENGLYHGTTLDLAPGAKVQQRLVKALERAKPLVHHPGLTRHSELQASVTKLQDTIDELEASVRRLFSVFADMDATYAHRTAASAALQDAYLSGLTAIAIALDESHRQRRDRDKGALPLWQDLQLKWVHLIIRSQEAGPGQRPVETSSASLEVQEILGRLTTADAEGMLGTGQGSALKEATHAYTHYKDARRALSNLKRADQWRSELSAIREEVRPLLDRAHALNREISEILSKKFASTINGALAVPDQMVLLIFVFALFALALMGIAYLSFVRYLHRPLRDVVGALEAAGRGEPYALQRGKHTEEIAKLHRAFDNMVEQVRSRQARLASIVDNVSDGIITIDRTGTIETFNRAAQRLFGYTQEEAVGNKVTILMPEDMRGAHDQHLIRYQYTGEKHAIGREREEIAQRKDGSTFPMSIKISEVLLEGRQFFTAVVSDISERKAAIDRLKEMAEHDSLTGLHNRRYFLEELARAVERASRGRGELALLYLDLDNFKFVNDTLGHQAGDELLVEITDMLAGRVRKGDLIARLGGDEFAILLYDVSAQTAQHVAENYRTVLAEYKFMYRGGVVDIGCSIGVAPFTDGLSSKEDLLARADLACHIAKSGGRNRVHMFDASNQEEVEGMSADMGWARAIKDALANDGFVILYQPIVDSERGAIHSHEALLRMKDPAGELISAAGFLSAAERFGLITDIDRWVISHAIQDLAASGRDGIRVNVNLSAKSIDSPSVLEFICEEIEHYGVDPRLLTFEITETTAITNLGVARSFFEGLRRLGCHAALDDFGTGYSSFAYLKELPVDYVKIDGGFVQNLDSDYLNVVMVKAMHEVAVAMGKKTVAEFVESEAVREILRGIGINYQQGYLVGMPMPKSRYAPQESSLSA